MDDEHDTVPEPASGRTRPAERPTSSRYEVGERIGKGGMGEVLDAFDTQLKRSVAIKRMLDREPSDRTLARFLREARVQARLDHPSIVPVHELGRDAEGRSYFVMKRLAGTTLREILKTGGRAQRQRLLRAFADVCLAVELAHTRGVIHRDLKPENIMLGDFGEVYVLDWGVAKVSGESDSPELANLDSSELETRVGTVIGTKGYMAPEQARGEANIDARADVFALGCILREILTDVDRAAPPELDDLCALALATDRDQRPSARELATRVQQYLDGDRDLERRRALATDHLGAAVSALSSGDDPQQRSIAMREAGRSLALDPTRAEAAELIGRLMLDVPVRQPAEVQQALESERIMLLQRNGPAVIGSLVAAIVVSLFLYVQTDAPLGPIVVLDALAAVLIGLTLIPRFTTRFVAIAAPFTALAVAGMIMIVALLFPPILIGTALATLTAVTAPHTMQHHRRWFSIYTTSLLLLAVLGPGVAEFAGLLPKSTYVVADGLHMIAPALQGSSESMMLGFGFTYSAVMIGLAGWLGYVTRQSEQAARRQVHLQAWHLRQLVVR